MLYNQGEMSNINQAENRRRQLDKLISEISGVASQLGVADLEEVIAPKLEELGHFLKALTGALFELEEKGIVFRRIWVMDSSSSYVGQNSVSTLTIPEVFPPETADVSQTISPLDVRPGNEESLDGINMPTCCALPGSSSISLPDSHALEPRRWLPEASPPADWLILPLTAGPQTIGFLIFLLTDPSALDESEQTATTIIANLIAGALEHRRFEAYRAQSQERLNGILASLEDAVWAVEPHSNALLFVNPVAERILGRTMVELMADPWLWFSAAHPEDRKLVENWRQTLDECGHAEFQYRIIRPDGEVRWLYVRLWLAYSVSGAQDRIDGIASDVTERIEAAHALQEARRKEVMIAGQIQQMLLIGHPPEDIIGAEIASLTIPSGGVDGDFYDFIRHDASCFDLIVGDVMGKGIPAALIGAATKSAFLHALAHLARSSPINTSSHISPSKNSNSTKQSNLSVISSFPSVSTSTYNQPAIVTKSINETHLSKAIKEENITNSVNATSFANVKFATNHDNEDNESTTFGDGKVLTLPTPAALTNFAHKSLTPQLINLKRFLTLCFARFELAKKQLTIVDAGHTKTLLMRPSTGKSYFLEGENCPFGFDPDELYSEFTVDLMAGDILVFFSDGLTEATNQNGEMFETDRLEGLVRQSTSLAPEALLKKIHQSAIDFTGSTTFEDDLTLIVVKIKDR